MEYLFTHCDYFKLIQSYLPEIDKNNLLLVNKKVYSNLEFCEQGYQDKRKFWNSLIKEYQVFKQTLISNVNKHKQRNKFFQVFVFMYYDGPLNGLGFFDGQFCFFGHRQEIVKPKFRVYPDHYDEYCSSCDEREDETCYERYEKMVNNNEVDDECMSDWYFDITPLDNYNLDIILRATFVIKDGMSHWFSEKSGFYKPYNPHQSNKLNNIYRYYFLRRRKEIEQLEPMFCIKYNIV